MGERTTKLEPRRESNGRKRTEHKYTPEADCNTEKNKLVYNNDNETKFVQLS